MKTLELFCGTKSFTKVAQAHGCMTKTLDNDPAPRGSRGGTQGLEDDVERGRIPAELFEDILKAVEK